MDSAALAAALEAGSLPPAEFSHANHVRLGWHYLQRRSLRDAAYHLRDVLQAYVQKLGAGEKFHLTLTLSFMHLIYERMGPAEESWEDFCARNPDLFSEARSLIGQHYSAERLDAGRASFAESDRLPLP